MLKIGKYALWVLLYKLCIYFLNHFKILIQAKLASAQKLAKMVENGNNWQNMAKNGDILNLNRHKRTTNKTNQIYVWKLFIGPLINHVYQFVAFQGL